MAGNTCKNLWRWGLGAFCLGFAPPHGRWSVLFTD